jgi:NodT family efflux transporter outer membrane factor (OMF) lipoprotein
MCIYSDEKPAGSKDVLVFIGAILLISMVLTLGGCTVGPDYEKPETKLNENWNQAGDSRVLIQTDVDTLWWKTFNDVTLDQLVQMACQQNLPLQIAGLRILEARARLGVAIGGQYPQQQELFGSAAAVGISDNAANNVGTDKHFGDYQAGFDAAWELDFWGKFRRDVQAAHADLIATAADYDDAIVTLTAEVARTYTVIRTLEALLELTRQNARIQEEGLQIAESRFRNGATTELDVTQARTLLESTRAVIPQLEAGLLQGRNALSTLLGQPTGAIETLLNEHKGIPEAPADVAVSMPAELLRRRPDIRSAELSAAAQCARIGIAKADLYPSFSLFGQIGLQSSSDGGVRSSNADFDNLWDSDSVFYSAGPGFQWPIFNYGRIENNIRIQDARFQQLLVNYQDTVLRAAQEVEDATAGFLRAQEAKVFEQNSVDAAQRSVEIALVQYREGAVDYQRVLDTQRALLQEQNNLVQISSSVAVNLIALYKALGGGWQLRQGQPVIAEATQAQMQERTDWGSIFPPPQPPPLAPETLELPPPARDIPLLQKPEW